MIGQDYELQAVFFDLDGTLVDSAPDLIVAMQRLRAELGESAVDVTAIGEVVSKGGRAMLRRGFPDVDDARIELLLPRFLDLYAEAIATHTRLYSGMDEVLTSLERSSIRWGVVTNKPGRLARALLAAIDPRTALRGYGVRRLPAVAQARPGTAAACLRPCRSGCARSVYVGDDMRDIEAGQRAGMKTIAAGWGYLNGEDPRACKPTRWRCRRASCLAFSASTDWRWRRKMQRLRASSANGSTPIRSRPPSRCFLRLVSAAARARSAASCTNSSRRPSPCANRRLPQSSSIGGARN
jgi:phosphoglycolate phosphatase